MSPPLTSVEAIARRILARTGRLEIVQLGAFIGATANDPLFALLKELATDPATRGRCRAVLVEPVRPFFDELLRRYADCIGTVLLENLAIGEAMAMRPFWRAATTRMPHEDGLPDFLLQLGSLRPDRVTALWDRFEAVQPDHAPRAAAMRRWLVENRVEDLVVTITLGQLLDKHRMSAPDLVVIDVEGYEWPILRALDLTRHRPRTIVFEHVLMGADRPACVAHLEAHGYEVACFEVDAVAVDRAQVPTLGFTVAAA